jgi:hypothetical protein
MTTRRATFLGLALFAVAGVFSGCVVFQQPPTVKQLGKKPKVSVKFRACMSNSEMGSTCPDRGNSDDTLSSGDWRVLVGFRVPKGTKAPQSFEAGTFQTNGGGTTAPVLSRDASYKRELNQRAPRNANKFKYLGYSSEPINVTDDTGTSASALFRVKMTVPEDLVGKKFKVLPVLGVYEVSDVQPASGPIDCGDDLYEEPDSDTSYLNGTYGVCIDAPSKDVFKPLKVKIKPKH